MEEVEKKTEENRQQAEKVSRLIAENRTLKGTEVVYGGMTHAGRSVSAGELNGLCEVLFGVRALEGMIGLVGGG